MDSPEYIEAKNEAYRRIGRNLILFQQVELSLKILLNDGRIEGTVSELKNLAERRAANPDKRTLGMLVNPLLEFHLTPFNSELAEIGNGREVAFSFRITFEHTPEQRLDFKRQMEALVAERNTLVHHTLTTFRFDSLEGCVKASEALERQRELILPVRNRLRSFVESMVAAKNDLRENLEERIMALWHAAKNPPTGM